MIARISGSGSGEEMKKEEFIVLCIKTPLIEPINIVSSLRESGVGLDSGSEGLHQQCGDPLLCPVASLEALLVAEEGVVGALVLADAQCGGPGTLHRSGTVVAALAGCPRRGRAVGRTMDTHNWITLRQHGVNRKCNRHAHQW